ncbi:MAG: glycosyltransferase [Deltaproteobacteria bacterium]|nr:glycosyltransferase [Deltaproteobacteria bacterium]
MNIVIFTNTYKPHVGGVANSVERLAHAARGRDHRVCIVTPTFPDMPEDEDQHEVIRVPAIQNFNATDFSVSLPVPMNLRERLRAFDADLIHSQHPFLLGDTALRWAESQRLPLLFTYHTMYEQYTHYVPADSPALKRFVVELCTGYANLCDHVIAPSESIKRILQDRGITTTITPIPTGVDCEQYRGGDGHRARQRFDIPKEAFLLGHVGRLAPEKNLIFLAEAAARALKNHRQSWFVVAGDGPEKEQMQRVLEDSGVMDRTVFAGVQTGEDLVDLYTAMDVFVFASKTETQGMVLAEAMAAGVPVVGLDANGVRDIISHQEDGFLVTEERSEAFVEPIEHIRRMGSSRRNELAQNAYDKAAAFSTERCLKKMLRVYADMADQERRQRQTGDPSWEELIGRVKAEWELWSNRLSAAVDAVSPSRVEMPEGVPPDSKPTADAD